MKFNFPELYLLVGGDRFLLKVTILVGFARVFYHCHYFGDCVIGALLGYLVAVVFNIYDLVLPIETLI